MPLQLRGGVVEKDLLHLLLFLEVKERELLHQVVAHHLKVLLGICTLFAGLGGGGRGEGGGEGGKVGREREEEREGRREFLVCPLSRGHPSMQIVIPYDAKRSGWARSSAYISRRERFSRMKVGRTIRVKSMPPRIWDP